MSSLWTPGGEHRVEREPEPPKQAGEPPASAPPQGGGGEGPRTEEERAALEEEFAQLESELLAAPVEDVIANHCYGLFQLAALHLGQSPPNLDKARLAIDAFGAVVEGLGPRLGAHAENFTDGLAQLRLAYVQLRGAADAGNGEVPEEPPAGEG